MYGDINIIRKVAKQAGWKEIDHQEYIKMLSFVKGFSRINVYYSKMTVATCIDHPTKGRTQLFRKYVDDKLLKKIFHNPRIHTSNGYR